jgi:hypothetical protein
MLERGYFLDLGLEDKFPEHLFAPVEAYKRGVDLSDASRADDLPSNGPLTDVRQSAIAREK